MAEADAPLLDEIRRRIAAGGPMPVADYMRLCLTHPQHGYYVKRDPLGAGGDFITSPEISQMFGELIGVWMAALWRQMGAPENFRIVELGPGRGTLLDDALRATRAVPGFREAAVVHLVEISPALRETQERRLAKTGLVMMWHDRLEDVPGGPSIIVANEFIDALAVHQAVKQADGWHERVITVGAEDNLVFDLAPEPMHFFATSLPHAVRHAAAAQMPTSSPNIWLISGEVVKSPATPNGSRLA